MNCPHCQKDLLENYGAAWCPYCGKDLSPARPEIESQPARLAPVRFHAVAFFLVLLAPPLLTMLSAAMFRGKNEPYSVAVGLFGGGAAGIACGIMLGLKAGETLLARIGLSLFFAVIMVVVCIMLCCFGCNLGGYQLRFN